MRSTPFSIYFSSTAFCSSHRFLRRAIYFEERIQYIANYVSSLQSDGCILDIETISKAKYKDLYYKLKQELIDNKITESEYVTGRKCFALIDLELITGNITSYICFSGLFDSTDDSILAFSKNQKLADAIKKIEDVLNSKNKESFTRITANTDIRYYYDNEYITLKDVIICNAQKNVRMFSCCERKFFTVLENTPHKDVKEYRIYIKYAPCELCIPAINCFEQCFSGKIYSEKNNNTPTVKDKCLFDSIADKTLKYKRSKKLSE